MQVAREKSQKIPLPFSGSLSGSIVRAKELGLLEEREEGGSSIGKKSRPPHQVVEKFALHPFHGASTSFHSSPYESIRITSDLGPLRRPRRVLPLAPPRLCKLPLEIST